VNVLDAALGYAARGWPVLPLMPRAKVPAGALAPHGLKDATTSPDIIRHWWGKSPDNNVGLATGIAFDVLDVDGDEGMAALVMEMPTDAPTIDGPTVVTGNGTHCYLAVTGLGNRTGVLPQVDFRGQGGYVVAPPSVHPSGAFYGWHCGEADPEFGIDAPIQPAPAWLLELLAPSSEPSRPAAGSRSVGAGSSAYGRRALEAEVGKVLLAPIGQRNHTLNRAAFALGSLVTGGVLDVDYVIDALLVAAERCGLDTPEARRTIASGLSAGAAQPRRALA
jgi:hypothetical protein